MDSSALKISETSLESAEAARPGFLFQMLSGKRREVGFWLFQLAFWCGAGLVATLMSVAFRSTVPELSWLLWMRMAVGVLQTTLLRSVYQQPFFRQRSGGAKSLVVVFSLVTMVLLEFTIVRVLIATGVSVPETTEMLGNRLLIVRFIVLGIWSAFYFAIHLLEREHQLALRATKAELASRENELRHLQAQTSPHFLLNALSSVQDCKDDPQAVEDVTRSLSDYLRFLLRETQPLEPLSLELEALEKYLSVQTSRFQRKLICRIQSSSAARSVMVPPMLIQPLLEDAFHQHSPTDEHPLHIWLTSQEEKGFLLISVSNTCGKQVGGKDPVPGRGFISLRHRIGLSLGPQARVQRQTDNGWVRVTIHIPLPANSRKS